MTDGKREKKSARHRISRSLIVKGTAAPKGAMNFATLAGAIKELHERCAAQAGRAVNLAVTMRNCAGSAA